LRRLGVSRKLGIPAFCRTVALFAVLLPSLTLAIETPIAFSTAEGEAWTFRKQVEVAVRPGACDTVTLSSPLGTATAPTSRGHAHARLLLRSGDNPVQAQCMSRGAPRGDLVTQHWFVRARDMPVARVRLRVTKTALLLDASASETAPARTAPLVAYRWRVRPAANPAPLRGLPAHGKRIALAKPTVDGDYFLTLQVTDGLGRADESTAMFRVRRGRAEMIGFPHEHAAWIDRAIVYGIEPPCFGRRGFADVTARLEAMRALGVNTLWLTPITTAPSGDFGYAITDQFRVREEFGTEAQLRELIAQAHANGLRVILDLVVNHVSERHPYFADATRNGPASPYFDFFQRTRAGAPVHYFDWANLENLNFDSPEVQRMVIEASARWVRDYDVDGFRVDAAWGPRQRAPGFWPRWSAELKRIKPDLMLLAEASSRDGYYLRNGYDAAYDWTEKLGHWAWQDAFADDHHTAERLRARLRETQALPSSAAVFRFLNNNDTGPRFITRHGANRTRVAAAMLLTLPGLPGLYCGDEVGAEFEPYRPHGPVAWDDAQGLRDWYTRLIALRAKLPALRSPELRVLDVGAADQLLAYVRPSVEGDGGLLVLLNFGALDATFSLTETMIRAGWRTDMVDVLNGAPMAARRNDDTIDVPGYGVRILQRP
jgi:cyclomaltodextrinase / maltogenic alpha-amylase / neopullulanase